MPGDSVKQRRKQPDVCNSRVNASEPRTEELRSSARRPTLSLLSILSPLSALACLGLLWVVSQQGVLIAELQHKLSLLHQEAHGLQELRTHFNALSDKLDSAEEDLQRAVSSTLQASQLDQEVAHIRAAVSAAQDSQRSDALDLQTVTGRFLNVTESWQEGLRLVTQDLVGLRVEVRDAHTRTTGRVNEAETMLRKLEERLEELQDGTARNCRALARTEEEDARRVEEWLEQLEKRIRRLEEQRDDLNRQDATLRGQLEELTPKAQRCEEQVPAVEQALHSILRLSAELGSTQRRVEELTLQVLGVEDGMLKAVTQILDMRREMDSLPVDRDDGQDGTDLTKHSDYEPSLTLDVET